MMHMDCDCEQKGHSAPIKTIEVSAGAIERTAEILKEYQNICLVADENTYAAAGKRVYELLIAAKKKVRTCILPAGSMATAENVGNLLIEVGSEPNPYDINAFSQNPDFVLAVGSGSVNDVSRMVSYRLGIEYGVCGTAPSMDGYISVVAPLLVRGKKIIYNCSTARHIIIDLDVCSKAPYELLIAGIGDMIGKHIAILDWELSHWKTGEYFCQKTADMVIAAANQCIEHAFKVAQREPEDIRAIVDGLLCSGLGIAYTGSSRPASGTEHMVGQTWEVIGLEEHHKPQLHGVEVGQATFTAISIFRKLYRETDDKTLKAFIGKYLPAFDRICELQKVIKIPFTVQDKKMYIDGILRGRTFRVRYTVLQYLYEQGKLEEYAEAAYQDMTEILK